MIIMDFEKITKEAVVQALLEIKKKMASLKMRTLLLMIFYTKVRDIHLN